MERLSAIGDEDKDSIPCDLDVAVAVADCHIVKSAICTKADKIFSYHSK